jgi:hypothetical protein
MSLRALLLACRPLPLSLLRRATKHARVGSWRVGFRGAHLHQLRAKHRNASTTRGISKIKNGTKNSTYQLAGGEHLEIPQGSVAAHGPGVDGAPRPGSRVLPQEGALHHPRPRHQGDDPPVVEEGEDGPRGPPAARQIPQRGQKRVQPIPVLGRGHPVAPGVGPLPEHQTGVGGRPGSSLRR